MDNERLGNEVRRLRQRIEGSLCAECPGPGPYRTVEVTRIIYPDGTEVMQRVAADEEYVLPELCDHCPYGLGGEKPTISVIEVVRTIEASADGPC